MKSATTEPLTVTQLTLAIKANVEQAFPMVWVAGEVSNVSRHQASGHTYFSIKDSGAQIPAVMWRSIGLRHKFDMKDGLAVVVRGRLTVYPPHGKYQLDVEKMEPQGLGARELALRQLREKLLTKGYFDPARKKPLPRYPRRIALITSPSGAAVRDMLQVLTTRWPLGDTYVCPVAVQGEGAAEQIAATIHLLNRLHSTLKIDALIVGRGGGSVEDLWAFNEECVADAIFLSTIPVISAVGHEIDVSLSDLVADVHALTPTDAANKIVPDRAELVLGLRDVRNRMEDAMRRRLQQMGQRLDTLATRGVFRRPLDRVRERETRLDELATRLHRAVRQTTTRCNESMTALAGRLETLSPLNVLARGYSLTRVEATGELVRNASLLQVGQRLVTMVARGTVTSTIDEVQM